MILAIKTSDLTIQLYLVDNTGQLKHDLSWASGRALSDQIVAKIQEFLHSANQPPPELSGVIVFSGPGSFTSLRIGHAVANALADSLNVPVVGAADDHWLADGSKALKTAKPGRPALPHYGADAHITKPKP